MSILFASANGVIDSTPVTGYPFTLACWFWADAAASEAPVVGLFNSATDNNWATLGVGGGKIQLRRRSSASNQVLESAAAYTTGTWHAIVGVFENANLCTLYLDDAAAVTQTTAVTPAGLNRIGFGRYLDSTPTGNFNGRASHICLWNVALTAKEAAQFTGGQSPFSIRSSALQSLWDGRSSNPGRDIRGKRAPTWTNIASHDSEPPVSALLQIYSGVTKPQIPAAAGLFIAHDSPAAELRAPITLTAGKGQLFDWTIDPTTRTAKVRVNGGAWQSAGYQDVLKAVQGNAVIGLPLVDGVPTGTNNNFILNSLAVFNKQLSDSEWDTVHAEMGKMIPPIVPDLKLKATVGHVTELKLLENAEDAAGDGLKIVSVTQPADAAVTIKDADAGIVSYDAKSLPTGTKNSFSFTVTNKFFKPTTATANCEVTIAALQPPVLTEATLAVDATVSTDATYDVLANATDPAGRPMTITAVTVPTAGGTASIVSQKIKYTPKTGFIGTDTFTYTIKNDWNASVVGTVSVTVAAAADDVPHKYYRVVGCNMHTSTQGDGDSANKAGVQYRITAALSAPLEQIVILSQGCRQFYQQGDTHAHGNSGNYEVAIYGVNSSNRLDSTKLKAKHYETAYPGKQLAKNNVAGFDAWDPPYPPVGNGNHKLKGVELIAGLQSLNLTGATPPSNYGDATWRSVQRISLSGYHKHEVYDGAGTDTTKRYTATKGEVLFIQNKNLNDDTGENYARDNEAYSAGAPQPGKGADVPFDLNLASFGMGDNAIEFRRTPFIMLGYRVNGKIVYYGNPWYYLNKAGSWSKTEDGLRWHFLYANRAVRQIMTPPEDYKPEVMAHVYIHAFRYAGISGYDNSGRLMVRVRRATLGTQTFSDYWPSSGWHSFGATDLKYVNLGANYANLSGQTTSFTNYDGTASTTFENYLKTSAAEGESGKAYINFVKAALPDTFKMETGYHYAVELRAEYSSVSPVVKTCYAIQPTAHLYYVMATFPSGGDDIRTQMPQVWKPGSFNSNKPREYNCIEQCSDITASTPSWTTRPNGTDDILPVSIYPKND